MVEKYICELCTAQYLRSDLQELCETVPLTEPLPRGIVYKRFDERVDIINDFYVEQ